MNPIAKSNGKPLFLVALIAALFVWHCRQFWWFTIDDAAISFAYAANLAQGHGFVATEGVAPVEGFSNPLWVAFLALASAAGGELELFAKVMGTLVAAIAIVLIYFAARKASDAPWLATLAPALLAAFTGYALWSQAGLENGLLAVTLAGAVSFTVHELETPGARPWSAFPLALAVWCRPEAPIYVAVIISVRLAFAWRRGLPLGREAWVVGTAIASFGALQLARWLVFQEWWPNTFFAKRARLIPQSVLRQKGQTYLLGFLHEYRAYFFVWAPLLAWRRRAARPALVLGLGLMAAAFFFAWYAGGDWARQYRFMTPAWLGLALVTALGVAGATELPQRLARLAPVMLAAMALLVATAPVPERLKLIAGDSQFHMTAEVRRLECLNVAALMQPLLVTRPQVLEMDVGGMSYCGKVDVLDHVGLTDRTVPRVRRHMPSFREYVFHERAPDFAMARDKPVPVLRNSPELHTLYLEFVPRGWEEGYSAWIRRDLVLAPFALPPIPNAPGAYRGARVTPAVARPGGKVLVELAYRVSDAAWPSLRVSVGDGDAVMAQAVPDAQGRSPLKPGDVAWLRGLLIAPEASGVYPVRAEGVIIGELVVDAARSEAANKHAVDDFMALERQAIVDAERQLTASQGASFAARRLLHAASELDREGARRRLVELPLPEVSAGLLSSLERAAAQLLAEARSLPPDSAYARLVLATRAAPRRADIRRMLDEVRRERQRRYSFLEPSLLYELERGVGQEAQPSITELAAAYLAAGQDAEVLALARAHPDQERANGRLGCQVWVARRNLAFEVAAPPGCTFELDSERARYVMGGVVPEVMIAGFEKSLEPFVPEGAFPSRPTVNVESDSGPAHAFWSGEGRAESSLAGRGRLAGRPMAVKHRHVMFMLSAKGQGSGGEAVLLVDGHAVLRHPAATQVPEFVIWDLAPYAGRCASLVFVDDSDEAAVALDAVTWGGVLDPSNGSPSDSSAEDSCS